MSTIVDTASAGSREQPHPTGAATPNRNIDRLLEATAIFAQAAKQAGVEAVSTIVLIAGLHRLNVQQTFRDQNGK